jgi:hypothetical protein
VGAHPSLLPPSLPPLMKREDGHIDVCTHACTHACTSTPGRCFSSLLHRAPSRFEIQALDMHVWSMIFEILALDMHVWSMIFEILALDMHVWSIIFEIQALDMHVWSIISACELRSMPEPIATNRSPWRVQGWANVHCAHVRRSPAAPTPVRPHRPPSTHHSTQQVGYSIPHSRLGYRRIAQHTAG